MTHPLLQAAAIIENFVSGLNDAKSTCDCCGVVRYENWNEHNRAVELTSIVTKLKRFAPTLPYEGQP